MYSGFISLLANYATEFNVLSSTALPSWPVHNPSALNKAFLSKSTILSSKEVAYIVWLKTYIKTDAMPTASEFQQNQAQAMTTRDKYSLLKDFQSEKFYDLIAEVIHIFENDGRTTMYLSDYTAHPLFYNNVWGAGGSRDRDGDEYNYLPQKFKPKDRKEDEWPGPYGKMSLQLTAFDGHVEYIRTSVKVGDWVRIKNVQARMGRTGGCLEGFLRGDRNAYENQTRVQVLVQAENPEINDSRWVEAVRRKKVYWTKFNKQKDAVLEEAEDVSTSKRKRTEPETKTNAKKLRKEKRAAVEQSIAIYEQSQAEALGLNSSGKIHLLRSYVSL